MYKAFWVFFLIFYNNAKIFTKEVSFERVSFLCESSIAASSMTHNSLMIFFSIIDHFSTICLYVQTMDIYIKKRMADVWMNKLMNKAFVWHKQGNTTKYKNNVWTLSDQSYHL